MVSPNVSRLLEETKVLTVEERRQLAALLGASTAEGHLADVELDSLLISKGIMSATPAKPTAADLAQAESWRPVAIEGKPLSQTIIEDRR